MLRTLFLAALLFWASPLDITPPRPATKPMAKTIPFDVNELYSFFNACVKAHIRYGWGAKIAHGAVPGRDFTATDCSGYVDEQVYRASGGDLDLPAGSWAEEEQIKTKGFESCRNADGLNHDGVVRIAFYPGVAPEHVRHVVLILNGRTYESHGGVGVDSRVWAEQGWMANCNLYVLARPLEIPTPAPKSLQAAVRGEELPALIIDDSSYVGLKALQEGGVLTVLGLSAGKAKVHHTLYGTFELALEIVAGVGYVPALSLAHELRLQIAWDNVNKRVTIG